MKRFIIRQQSGGNISRGGGGGFGGGGIYLSHISDLHTWQPEKFSHPITIRNLILQNKFKDFKQIQGFLNVKYNRGPNLYQVQVLQKIIEQIAHSINQHNNHHHLLISGDITNISHLEEFKLAKKMLVDEFGKLIGLEKEEELFKYATLVPGKYQLLDLMEFND